MLRIHFTASDLARTRIVTQPDPLWETALSMHVLRSPTPDALLEGWRLRNSQLLQATSGLKEQLALASILNPPLGYFPDFLTPAGASAGIDAGLQALLSTPKKQLKAEISQVCEANPAIGSTVEDIGSGRPSALLSLAGALRRYYDVMLAPLWTNISAAVEADRTLRGQQLADGGPEAMLSDLAPLGRFRGDVLELLHHRQDRDVHLDGRGLTLIPSYFKESSTLMVLADPELAPVIVYPVHRGTRVAIDVQRTALSALIGRSRAAVLEQAASGATVSQIAKQLDISQPNATKHLAVLRDAGLLQSVRMRNATRHAITPLGQALLKGQ